MLDFKFLRICPAHMPSRAYTITVIGLLTACAAGPGVISSTPFSPLNSPLVVVGPSPDAIATQAATERNIIIKLTVLANEDATREARRLTPQPVVTPGPYPTLVFPPTSTPRARFDAAEHGGTPAGSGYITQLGDNSKSALIRNTWVEVSPDGLELTLVMAGGPHDYTTGTSGPYGFLLLYRSRIDSVTNEVVALQSRVEYRTPDETGILEVVGADGEVIELRSAGGKRYFFSVPERRWLLQGR